MTSRPSRPRSRARSAQSRPSTSRLAVMESASAKPPTPIGPTSQAISGTFRPTATIAQITGVRVSWKA